MNNDYTKEAIKDIRDFLQKADVELRYINLSAVEDTLVKVQEASMYSRMAVEAMSHILKEGKK